METMSTFFREFLNSIAYFLGSEPIIYVFGLFCLCIVVKVFKEIIT